MVSDCCVLWAACCSGLSVEFRASPHSDHSLRDLSSDVPNSTPPRCANSQLLATCECYGFDPNCALASDSRSLIILFCSSTRNFTILSLIESLSPILFFAFLGAYYSLSCEPTLGENQIFHSMVKRQVMKTRDAIKLIGDGKAQKLKKDKVIESWIKVDIGTVWAKKKLMSFLSKTTSQFKEIFGLLLFVFPLFFCFFIYINCVAIMHM